MNERINIETDYYYTQNACYLVCPRQIAFLHIRIYMSTPTVFAPVSLLSTLLQMQINSEVFHL